MLSIEAIGLRKLRTNLVNLDANLETEDLLDDIGAILLNRIRTRFLQQLDTDGEKWPVSEASRNRTSGGTLFDTGNLFHSIELQRAGPNARIINTDVEYAHDLHFGTSILPRREFIGASDDDIRLIETFVIGRIERSFL